MRDIADDPNASNSITGEDIEKARIELDEVMQKIKNRVDERANQPL